jgi:hypothetical protein
MSEGQGSFAYDAEKEDEPAILPFGTFELEKALTAHTLLHSFPNLRYLEQ